MRREPGRIKERLAQRLLNAGIRVDPYDFWMQEGAYRSRFWDLARWGARGRFTDPLRYSGELTIYSWDTMSDCARFGVALTTHRDCYRLSPWEVEVSRSDPK